MSSILPHCKGLGFPSEQLWLSDTGQSGLSFLHQRPFAIGHISSVPPPSLCLSAWAHTPHRWAFLRIGVLPAPRLAPQTSWSWVVVKVWGKRSCQKCLAQMLQNRRNSGFFKVSAPVKLTQTCKGINLNLCECFKIYSMNEINKIKFCSFHSIASLQVIKGRVRVRVSLG